MSTGLFLENHPRQKIPELSAQFHRNQWFVGNGAGGFLSIKRGDSIYMSASNVAKDRMTPDDLYVYKASDSSVNLSPSADRKLVQCEIAGLILLIFKERKSTGAVLHCNGKIPSLTSLIHPGDEFKMKNQGVIKGLYNETLKRNYNTEEEVTVPIVDDINDSKLKQTLQKYHSATAILVRNQGIFVWAEDWQKCKAAAECYHQLMDISIEMEKLGLNAYTHPNTVTNVNSRISEVSSNETLDGISTLADTATPAVTPVKKSSDTSKIDIVANTVSVPSTSNANTPTEKPKQKNVTTPKTTPTPNKKITVGDKSAAKPPNRRQQSQNNGMKQGRVVKRGGVNRGGRLNNAALQGPGRRSAERQPDRWPRGGRQGGPPIPGPSGPPIGGPNQGPNGIHMGQPGPLMGGPDGPMMGQPGPLMGGPHGTFTGGPTNRGPPMGGPPMGLGFMGPQGPMASGGPMGPMGPGGPMRDDPMMHAQMRAAQHHAAKQQQRNVRGRGKRAAAVGQRRGDTKLKGAAKKEGGKNMPNKDVLMNY